MDPADAVRPHAFAHVEQQRARAAGEIHHGGEAFSPAGLRLLAVQRDDFGQDVRNPLRRVELAGLLARTGGELADEIFVGVAQRVAVGGELRQALGDPGDDRAQLRVSLLIILSELFGAEIDFRKKPGERALKRFVLDIFETGLERVEQVAVLGAGHVGDAGPEMLGADDVMRLEPHLFLEVRRVAGVPFVPDGQRRPPAIVDVVGVVAPEFLFRGLFVIVREVAQKQEREHVIAKIVGVHRSAEPVGDGPQRPAELFSVLVGHVESLVSVAGSLGNGTGLKGCRSMNPWRNFPKRRLFSGSRRGCAARALRFVNGVASPMAHRPSGEGKSRCISPCLCCLSVSIFRDCAASRASSEPRQSAMRCCSSLRSGKTNKNGEKPARVI